MIKFNKKQFLLLIFGIVLVIVTYLIYPKNNQIVEEKDLDSNIAKTEKYDCSEPAASRPGHALLHNFLCAAKMWSLLDTSRSLDEARIEFLHTHTNRSVSSRGVQG